MTAQHEPRIVVFPRGQLSPKDKERMTKAGILAVEADNPKDVCQIRVTQPLICSSLNGDAIVKAALTALCSQRSCDGNGKQTTAGAAMEVFIKLFSKSINEIQP